MTAPDRTAARWSVERAAAWAAGRPLLLGCNFVPSTAVNPIEMWQASTFDAATIERELGWAADAGLNAARVFLHELVWADDPGGTRDRIDRFLALAAARGIGTMLVLFDDCWHPDPALGPQPDPVPGVHNSRWNQCPGHAVARDPSRWGPLEAYVRGVVEAFATDERVVVWDVYNEPGNDLLPLASASWPERLRAAPRVLLPKLGPRPAFPLLEAAFGWARSAAPSQPLTAGGWFPSRALERTLVGLSDVVSFHHYGSVPGLKRLTRRLGRHGRPLLCTEYLARSMGNHFVTHLPVLRESCAGAFHWGLVAGRTQTIHSWLARAGRADGDRREPRVWFHDLLRADGSPYDPAEVELLRRVSGAAPPSPGPAAGPARPPRPEL